MAAFCRDIDVVQVGLRLTHQLVGGWWAWRGLLPVSEAPRAAIVTVAIVETIFSGKCLVLTVISRLHW